jgi:hypothetical protein
MSIFPQLEIKVGDLVIGKSKYGWDTKGAPTMQRHFEEPSLVLQIEDQKALIYLEQQGPWWYDISMLERVYVTEEFEHIDQRTVASTKFNYSDQSRDEDDPGKV